MSYDRLQHSGGAVPTTLGGDITSGATTLNLVSSSGWPDGSIGPFYIVIDPGLPTEEKILATTRTALTLNALTRGADGTSASAHSGGAVVQHCFTAIEADEANVAANKTIGQVTTKGDLLAATGNQTLGRVAAGADNTLPVYDSAQAAGLKTSKIVAANITAGTITTTEIADGTIQAVDLAANAVTTSKILDGAVTSAKILDGTIATGDIADAAITAAKLAAAPAVSEPLFHAGTFSGSTDGGGNAVIATGAAFTPRIVTVTPISPLTAVPFLTTLGPAPGQFTIRYTPISGSVAGISVAGHFVVYP